MYPPPHEGYPPNVSNSYQQPLVYPLKVNRRNTIKHPKNGNSKTKKRVRYAKNPGIRIISPSHDDGAHQFDYIDPQPFNNIGTVISEYEVRHSGHSGDSTVLHTFCHNRWLFLSPGCLLETQFSQRYFVFKSFFYKSRKSLQMLFHTSGLLFYCHDCLQ